MKVLVLGMPRTGTQSLADALERLGIGPVYHMREVGKNKHQGLWIEALDAKFEGRGEPYDREKFDRILGSYEAVADYPAAIFAAELLSAYPEARVILSVRHSEDAWLASMESTLWHAHTHQPTPNPSPMAPLSAKYHRHCWGDDLPTHGRTAYREHNALVRFLAESSGRRLLEYAPGDGWEPLCEFLGLETPAEPFPRSDDWAAYKRMVEAEKGKGKRDV
ncbi:P-loop containing nucleoside triphosphate hydrolase protein [Hypomontagnella submonticulosa]|nr:P-loop containing nucleoside triphosphate hydrolase protein [Hypomontagnella submonticulosa]